MNARELIKRLRQQPFSPFAVITSDGQRYVVRHPENVHLARPGVLYVFEPIDEDEVEAEVESPTVISLLHITTIEPAPDKAA